MKKITVMLLFGGPGPEHAVSVRSARTIASAIDTSRYATVLVGVTKTGGWFVYESIDNIEYVKKNSSTVTVQPGNSSIFVNGKEVCIDVVFPIVHGTGGEDGALQGLAQRINCPIVGTGIAGSAICMHKTILKDLLEKSDIETSPYMTGSVDMVPTYQHVTETLGSPVFVKAVAQGSSVGVHCVSTVSEYEDALEDVFRYGTEVLIETAIQGREVEIAIMGSGEDFVVSPLGEIVLEKGTWYSYSEKYADNSVTTTRIVTDLAPEKVAEIQTIAKKAYTVGRCKGFARVDCFLLDDGRCFVNEINTLPGFTAISMYPILMHAAGLEIGDLITGLITGAISEGLNFQ